MQYNTRCNALANFVKNATGGVLEEVVSKNPDLSWNSTACNYTVG